jgi:osmotically-inducible protein OsmY
MKTDREIQKDIEEELKWVPDVDDSDITVKVAGGIATLTGIVPNYYDRHRAECAAKRIRGCAGIATEIEVRLAFARTTDTEIARRAVEAFRAELPDIAEDVQVIVRDGHVSLEGAVDWQWQRQRLESSVRSLKGVNVVSNLVGIRPRPVPDDVGRRIEAAFKRNAPPGLRRASRVWSTTSPSARKLPQLPAAKLRSAARTSASCSWEKLA